MPQMYDTLAHIFEEFAYFLIGAVVSVSRVTLDGWENFGAGDHRAVIEDPAEQSQVEHL